MSRAPLYRGILLACLLQALYPTPLALAQEAVATPLANGERGALLAQAESLRLQRRWIDAAERYQQVLDHDPADRQAYHALVMTLSDNGNASRAWELMQVRPEWFDTDERLRLGNERVARLVGWGQAHPETEAQVFEESRLALSEARLQRERLPALPRDRSRRLDLDTMVALGQLQRFPEAVAMYRDLVAEDPALPPYALAAAGDALLGVRQPVEAAHVLQRAIAGNPDDYMARVLLAYAYLESERFAPAYALLEEARERNGPWVRGADMRHRQPNWRRYDYDRTHALALAQGEYLPEAQDLMQRLAATGPASADVQQVLGAVYSRRGWSEQALERYRIASTLDPRNVDARVGQAETLLVLQRVGEARAVLDPLVQLHGFNSHVQRIQVNQARHTGWQVDATARRGRSRALDGTAASPASPLGTRDGGHALQVQSPLIAERWRLLAHQGESWADFDSVRVRDRRLGAGIRYTHDRLDLRLVASRPQGPGPDGTGLGLHARWRFDDVLEGSLQVSRKDPDASLQARRAGITGDRVALGLDYAPSERTALAINVEHWRYSDGNRREGVGARLAQRLVTRPHFLLGGLVEASAGRGSRDDAPYFNPGRNAALAVGLAADHLAWRHYERSFRQRLSAWAGPQWQQDFGTHVVPGARYEHEWSFGTGAYLVYGATWARPVYDGIREHRVGLDVGLHWGTNR